MCELDTFTLLFKQSLNMDQNRLLDSETDLESRLRKKLRIVESSQDLEINRMQYAYFNALKGDFPGVSVFQDGMKWRLHFEEITSVEGVSETFQSLKRVLRDLAQTTLKFTELEQLFLSLLSEKVYL